MPISADQCRAGRGLLNWTQDQLATNASVSRATIADFENNTRQPIKNNLRSIEDSMFAAGIEFVGEEGTSGVGVRFRERKLEYINNLKVDTFNRRATLRMRFGGIDFLCHIDLFAVDDFDRYRGRTRSEEEYSNSISKILPIVLASAERHAGSKIHNGEMTVTYEMLSC